MSPALSRFDALLKSALLLATLGILAVHCHITTNPYLAYALLGSFVIHYRSSAGRPACLSAALILGLAYAMIYVALGASLRSVNSLGFLGVGSVAVLGVMSFWPEYKQRAETLRVWWLTLLFPAFLICSAIVLTLTRYAHPRVLDLYLYTLDGRLGFQPSFTVGRLLWQNTILREIAYYAYEALPLGMAFAFSLEWEAKIRSAASIVISFLFAAIGGYLIYNLFPAVGPIHVFGNAFPFSPPAVTARPSAIVNTGDPRNCMPSVHFTMALLIFWYSRQWTRWGRIFACGLLLLTIVATLGFGEHYLIDLVVAVPFALLAKTLATRAVRPAYVRMLCYATAGFLVSAWIFYLRCFFSFAMIPAAVSWALLVITVIPPMMLERELHQAATAALDGCEQAGDLEPLTGIEPVTSSLPRTRSTN